MNSSADVRIALKEKVYINLISFVVFENQKEIEV